MKFQALDSLRGLAALAIAVFHYVDGWGGYLAVDFFLVLSGFVLSHSYLYSDKPVGPAAFISHRIARLYPLHLFTLATFVATYYLVWNRLPWYPDGTLFTFAQHLTLTQNVGLNPSGLTFNYPSWSISVEFWVNVLFIFFVTKTTKSATLLVISLLCLLVIYAQTGHLDTHADNYFSFLNSGLLRGISSFLLGVIAYRAYLAYRQSSKTISRITALELACIIGIFFVVFFREEKLSSLDFLAPFLFTLTVFTFALERGQIARRISFLKYLGEISYSVYLNQISVLLLVRHLTQDLDLPRGVTFAAYLCALLVFSHLTYRFLEKPLRAKGRDFFARIVKS